MTALDLDVIREDAEWSSKRMNSTDVAYKVATVHVPALVAEVERQAAILNTLADVMSPRATLEALGVQADDVAPADDEFVAKVAAYTAARTEVVRRLLADREADQ